MIEKTLEEKGYDYIKQNLAIWLSDRKENIKNMMNKIFDKN